MIINIKVILLLMILLSSCMNIPNRSLNDDISLVKIINESKETQKTILLYIDPLKSNPMSCKDVSYICDRYIYYEINNKANIFSKIIHSEHSLFIAINGDSVISIFRKHRDVRKFYNKLDNLSEKNSDQDLKTITELDYSDQDIINGINLAIKLKYNIDTGLKKSELIELAEFSLENYPFFYNLYLLSELYDTKDTLKKKEIYSRLWELATITENNIYTSELLDIFQYINSGNRFNQSKLLFQDIINDIGNVKVSSEHICRYYFTNSSTKTIFILYASPSCGCTDVQWPKYPIRSGENDSIIVKFKGTEESVHYKTISIKTSEPANVILTIKANVIK